MNAAPPILRLYLHELGQIPLLDEKTEVRLASELKLARLAISKLAQALPESCREVIFAGDESGPELRAAWPVSDVECFVRKLVDHATRCPETTVAAGLRRILAHKSALDEARAGLILANLRLVVHIAKKYASSGLPLMDLIQEGNVGLLRAVEKFECERGFRFSTYALWWIKQSVERGIRDNSRTIRIPVHVSAKMRRVRSAARDLGQRLGRRVETREIARELRLPVAEVDEALSVIREPLSIDDRAGNGAGFDWARSCTDLQDASPFDNVSQREIMTRVESILTALDPREETILRLRFGIGQETARSLEHIGQRLRLSGERVRQIESVALVKMRRKLSGRGTAARLGVGGRAPVAAARPSP